MRKLKRRYLAGTAVLLIVVSALMFCCVQTTRADDYEEKLEAAELMQQCMDRVKKYRAELGLPLSKDDWHETGMIGEPYTSITTTSGALEAKRTTANPDMAALAVQMLREAGVKSGDTVGAGFSGSFPALNIAVMAACAVMDVNLIYIASVGASTYGANLPSLTFPDMAFRLVEDGLLPRHAAMITLGGYHDCGLDMDPTLVAQTRSRLDTYGIPFLYTEDYAENIAARMVIYDKEAPISCFIGVGGNLTTIGKREYEMPCGVVSPYQVKNTDGGSGLMEIYNAAGLPVLHFLNIKRLVADYGLPYDPAKLTPPGESVLYKTQRYPRLIAAAGLAGAAVVLVYGRRKMRREENV